MADRPAEIHCVYVCENTDCRSRGSEAIGAAIAAQLTAANSSVTMERYFCFGACPDAPNVVTYPAGIWYSHVTEADVPAIMAHLLGGPPAEQCLSPIDPALQQLILGLIDSGFGRSDPSLKV